MYVYVPSFHSKIAFTLRIRKAIQIILFISDKNHNYTVCRQKCCLTQFFVFIRTIEFVISLTKNQHSVKSYCERCTSYDSISLHQPILGDLINSKRSDIMSTLHKVLLMLASRKQRACLCLEYRVYFELIIIFGNSDIRTKY